MPTKPMRAKPHLENQPEGASYVVKSVEISIQIPIILVGEIIQTSSRGLTKEVQINHKPNKILFTNLHHWKKESWGMTKLHVVKDLID
ncbi:hypothetical protein J1N35_014628 [Gossypium stocksii]|uniref:Uncharacterized protein n=1 Tax=Gossypium stocksii TaxID=47602 RepID=A0A9D3VVA7_9ROSI|nr:hypothetical protein J1N35_014628 [Gossypium stocksii]